MENIDITDQQIIAYVNVDQMTGASDIEPGRLIKTTGYYIAGDGGGNHYISRAVTTTPSDRGSLLKSVGNPAIEFVALFANEVINVAQFGAPGTAGFSSLISENYFPGYNQVEAGNAYIGDKFPPST